MGVGVAVGLAVGEAVAVRVGVAVGGAVAVAVGVGGAHTPAGASFTRNLWPSPVPVKDKQYMLVPPSRLSMTSMVAGPFGTGKGRPLATTFSKPPFWPLGGL